MLVIENDDDALWTNVYSFEVGPDNRIYLAVAEYESDIWVMDLEWERRLRRLQIENFKLQMADCKSSICNRHSNGPAPRMAIARSS